MPFVFDLGRDCLDQRLLIGSTCALKRNLELAADQGSWVMGINAESDRPRYWSTQTSLLESALPPAARTPGYRSSSTYRSLKRKGECALVAVSRLVCIRVSVRDTDIVWKISCRSVPGSSECFALFASQEHEEAHRCDRGHQVPDAVSLNEAVWITPGMVGLTSLPDGRGRQVEKDAKQKPGPIVSASGWGFFCDERG